ncbi:septum formation protein Maf [Pedobacter sp. HDW13]|uniref:Maf family protein n=1 Tax=unclassified Pedobacter TaxID=2628915 RepID=UPI000F59D25F|nr:MULTISPECIES: Maf family nucleotide pyrophosphatase [unclassified Pedobacter]QIL40978.1 septum formation protein Maf [Pedobacter sp. HDW13]RQO65020.1 septum formation protein Maf [Pedobacter sp. KBW01]
MPVQFPPIILASKSPRRQELLSLMGLDFKVELKDVDESYPEGLSPAEIAIYISEKKARAFTGDGEIIITADTIVALNGEILGKPKDRTHAQEMLKKLSGSKHEVFTGVTLVKGDKLFSFYDRTEVTCKAVTAAEIDFYIDNYKPFDKAGSYGVQDWWGIVVVERIEGSYTNVMGLPTEKLYSYLTGLII